jgi:hypothetical protein
MFKNDLSINNIIWSKGPIRNKYSKVKTETSSSKNTIINIIKGITPTNNTVFIRNGSNSYVTDLEIFANHLELITCPIILITTDGDRNMPRTHEPITINKILESNMIIKWYTQNFDGSIIHPKLKHFPIGLDLHSPQWLIDDSISSKITFMINTRILSPTSNRIKNKILSDTHNSITHYERVELFNTIKNNNCIDFSTPLSFKEITELYNKYNFVLSPRGGGLDCHRTWELFLAGVIVITKTSSLDEMYTKNNLPVVILKDWSELNGPELNSSELNEQTLENKLQHWYKEHIDKTSIDNIYERLTFNYWLNT